MLAAEPAPDPALTFVAGTGSFAADIVEVVQDTGRVVHGLVELRDPARVGRRIHGLPVVGLVPPVGAVAVIGAGGDRQALRELLREAGWGSCVVVHPRAHVPSSAELADGAFVGPLAVLGAAARLAEDVLVARGALVGHHTRLGPGTVLNPGANVAGNVDVGAGVQFGMGCVVRDNVTIGAGAVVAAGAVVVADVAAGLRVRGVPARAF